MEPLAHKCSRDTFSRQVADGEVTRAQNRPHWWSNLRHFSFNPRDFGPHNARKIMTRR